MRQLEVAAAPSQRLREGELAAGAIEATHGAAHRVDLGDPHADAEAALQGPGKAYEEILALEAGLLPERLGGLLQLREVIVVTLQEVGDLLGGEARGLEADVLLPVRDPRGQAPGPRPGDGGGPRRDGPGAR